MQTTWRIGEHASPDIGNVTADGTQLWLSGRYSHTVYVLSAVDGHLIKQIDVGNGPTGCAYAPARPLLAGTHRHHTLTAQ